MLPSTKFRLALLICWMSLLPMGAAMAQPATSAPTQSASAPTAPAKRLVVRSYSLNEHVAKLDGQWQAMRLASDGNVYFVGSSHSHDHGAAYFRYEPAGGKLTMLCEDISRLCGEDPTKQIPQGKIHSDTVESNGKLYFATHLANYWPQAETAYSGAHLVSYDLRAGTLRDMGILLPRHTCYSGLAIDPKGRWAYALMVSWAPQDRTTEGTFVVRTDLATGKMTNLGEIPLERKISCHYFFVDNRGDCWFAAREHLYVVRAADGKIEAIDGALENVPWLDADGAPQPDKATGWIWGQSQGDGEKFLCTLAGKGEIRQMLYEFDAGRANAGKPAFKPLARIGATALGVTMAGDRVYFVRLGNGKAGPKGDSHHLLSAAWKGRNVGKVLDHGEIFDQDGRYPWRIEAMAADAKGKVFFSGDWYVLKDADGEVLKSEVNRSTLRLREKYDGTGDPQYTRLWRGQFFAVADVAKDLP